MVGRKTHAIGEGGDFPGEAGVMTFRHGAAVVANLEDRRFGVAGTTAGRPRVARLDPVDWRLDLANILHFITARVGRRLSHRSTRRNVITLYLFGM